MAKTNKIILTRPAVPSGEERGLLSRTAAGDRAYLIGYSGVTVRVEINQAREIVCVLPLIGRKNNLFSVIAYTKSIV